MYRLLTPLSEPRKAAPQSATTTGAKLRTATRKEIVPEMEYAYFDEKKVQYRDPIVEGIFP